VRGVAWVAADKWTNRLLGFVVLLVLARLLDPTAFANVFVSILAVIAGLGFDSYIVRARTADIRMTSTAFWISLGLSLVEYGAIILAAPLIAALFDAPDLQQMMYVLGAALPLGAIASIPTALLLRDLNMKPLAIRGVSSSLAGGAVAIVLAFAGAGAYALIFQLLTTQVVSCILLYAVTRWRPRFLFSRADARIMLRFGVSVVGTNIVHQLRDRGDELLIGGLLGPQALGFWVIATRVLRTAVDVFTAVVTTVSLSSFSRVADDRKRLEGAVRGAISATTIVVIPGLIALCVITPVFLPFAFGDKWEVSVLPAQILTLAGVFNVIQWVDGNIWWAIDRAGTELILVTIVSVGHFIAVAIAAPYGLAVVALAILARTLLLFPLRVLALKFIARISLSIYRDVWRVIVSGAFMGAGLYALHFAIDDLQPVLYLAIQIVVGLVLYFAATMVLLRPLVTRLRGDIVSLIRRRRGPATS